MTISSFRWRFYWQSVWSVEMPRECIGWLITMKQIKRCSAVIDNICVHLDTLRTSLVLRNPRQTIHWPSGHVGFVNLYEPERSETTENRPCSRYSFTISDESGWRSCWKLFVNRLLYFHKNLSSYLDLNYQVTKFNSYDRSLRSVHQQWTRWEKKKWTDNVLGSSRKLKIMFENFFTQGQLRQWKLRASRGTYKTLTRLSGTLRVVLTTFFHLVVLILMFYKIAEENQCF